MVPVATSGGVTLLCPEDGRYSFFNSPYPAHHLMTGVDIYPDIMHGLSAPSPITGDVLQIRQVKAPRSYEFEAPEHDVVTLIRSAQNPNRVVKILHVDTEAEVGETIQAGQDLGPMIRSGYFGYHTPLHAHIEVRPPEDPLRVRGGYHMDTLLNLDKLEVAEELTGTVTATRKGYAQIKLLQNIPWIVVDVGGNPGIIDGGIPIYGWFGTHGKTSTKGDPVKLLGKQIGIVTNTQPRSCVADCTEFDARLGSTPVDLFFILTPKQQTIVATSKKRSELDLRVQEEVSLTLS